jgi:hypothetical protein
MSCYHVATEVPSMKRHLAQCAISACLILLITCAALAQQQAAGIVPDRAKGISMHMLPKRVADVGSMQWGLVVSHSGDWRPQQKQIVFQTTQEFMDFVRAQTSEVQANGAWIVVTDPDAYSDAEKQFLEDIKSVCRKEKLPLFICRGKDLPNGWTRYDQ